MKIKKRKMWEWIIAIIVGIIIVFFVTRAQKNYNNKILNNAQFTIGKVTFYSSSKSGIIVPKIVHSNPKPTSVDYKYLVDTIEYENGYPSGNGISYIPDSGVQKGNKYLVIYNEKNPKESRMLFEYPIKDSKDFERYIKELKNNPKKLNNYRKKNKNK